MTEWANIGVFVSVCGSALVGLIFAVQKSKCSDINCCCGLLKCHRPKELIGAKSGGIEEDKLSREEEGI
jgi:hypothetical protein